MLRDSATFPPVTLLPSIGVPHGGLTAQMKGSGYHSLLPSILMLSVALNSYLCSWFVAQDEPEPAIRKSYQAVERHGETIRVRDTVLLKSGPRKTSTPYVAKISALWENPESGTCSSDWEPKEQLPSVGPCLEFGLAQEHHSWQSLLTLHLGSCLLRRL